MYGGFEFDMCVEAYDKLIQLITLVVIQSARHPAFQFGVVGESDVSRNRADLLEGLPPVRYQALHDRSHPFSLELEGLARRSLPWRLVEYIQNSYGARERLEA